MNLNTLDGKQPQFVLDFLLLVAGHFKFLKNTFLDSTGIFVDQINIDGKYKLAISCLKHFNSLDCLLLYTVVFHYFILLF